MQNCSHQRSLACSQIAVQKNHNSGLQYFRQFASHGHCGRFIGQRQIYSAIMQLMQNGYPRVSDYGELAIRIKEWGKELGFQAVGISDIKLDDAEARLMEWLALGHHGTMDYMVKHGARRARPAELLPGVQRVICVRMDYFPSHAADSWQVLDDGGRAYISRYALGRDYHKVLRNRLEKLAQRIRTATGEFNYRVFADSAPVMEVELARKAHLGWRGKHTLLLSREYGSWFFLGEIYTDLPLPTDAPGQDHCGSCARCIDICPTQAIVAPYQLDARRCISYLTIELKGSIPTELRPLIGNRIYGCDDCQLVCPWNRFARKTIEPDFAARHGLDNERLVDLFAWDESTFKEKLSGSPIYRIGYEQWLRNLAVGLGNAPKDKSVYAALLSRAQHPSALVREHVAWALDKQGK
jgi:epoxyqueuosine reductase